MPRQRVIVYGRVQGVWFRETTRRAAERQGVAGWVRNRPDGSVEAVFEGADEAIARLVELCRLGPPDAVVSRVVVTDERPEGLAGFQIV